MASNCDNILILAAHDVVDLEVSTQTYGSLSEWFFSDDFERTVKESEGEFSITIPILGVPVSFGGSAESADAWEKRSRFELKEQWDFTEISVISAFSKTVVVDALEIWLECKGLTAIGLWTKVDEDSDGVTFTFGYRSDRPRDTPGVVLSIDTSSDLRWTAKDNESIAGTELQPQGQAVRIPWSSDDADEGTVFLNTNRGTSVQHVQRPPKGRAIINYTISKQHPTATVMIDDDEVQVTTINLDHVKYKSLLAQALRRSGRFKISRAKGGWAAHTVVATLNMPDKYPNGIWKNAKFVRVAGGYSHLKTTGPTINGRRVQSTLKVWSAPRSFKLKAQIHVPKVVNEPASAFVEIRQGQFKIYLPGAADDITVSFARGGDVVRVDLESLTDQDPIEIEEIDKRPDGIWVWHCKIK